MRSGIAPVEDEDEGLQGGPPPAGPPTGKGEPQPAALDEELQEQASPEEQKQYETFVGHAMTMLYDETMLPKIVTMLRGQGEGSNPQDNLATTAQLIVKRVLDAATTNRDPPSTDVLVHAGQAVFELVAEVATEAGIHDFVNDKDALEGAWWKALDAMRVQLQKEGRLDDAMMKQDFEQLQQWDQSGFLQQALQKLSEEPPEAGDEEPTTGAPPGGGTGIAPASKPADNDDEPEPPTETNPDDLGMKKKSSPPAKGAY